MRRQTLSVSVGPVAPAMAGLLLLAAGRSPAALPNVVSNAVAYAQPRCVKIMGAGAGRETGTATGILVSPEGHVLTGLTVLLAGDRIEAVTADGRHHAARELRRSERLQAALLKIDAATPDCFALSRDPVGEPGDWAIALHNSFRIATGTEPLSVTLGILSARAPLEGRRRRLDMPYEGEALFMDAITSNPGAAGGAVVTLDGRLCGMIGSMLVSRSTGTQINYAVPVERLHELLDAPAASSAPPAQPAARDFGIRLLMHAGRRAPAFVDRVLPDSAAARAGLRADDLIVAFGDAPVRSCEEYTALEQKAPAGAAVAVRVRRGNEVLTLQLPPEPATRNAGAKEP